MSTKEFNAAWKELSPIQQEVADWDEGPLLVLAGPGSGKTRVLTCHIAKILDDNPNENFRILGLTFTNKAADEMRNRVINYMPGQEGRLFLGTFHSFCADILRQHGVHLGINPNFNIYGQDTDLQSILNKAAEEVNNITDIERDILKKTLPVIQRLKSRLISPEQCRESFVDPAMGARMALIYPAYEAELTKLNSLDLNSLILKAYVLFTSFPVLAKRYRTVYKYICIDEFQDSNRAQYEFVKVLTGSEHRNLFVVADDDQIIYQWNGASHKRLEEFLKDYSPKGMQLPVNYRCPPEIVILANNLISHNILRIPNKKPLEAFQPSHGKATVRLLPVFPDFDTEVVEISKDIKNLHTNDFGSVVILGRSRRLLEPVESALRSEGIPAIISQRKDEFESTPFVWLHSILRLANNRQNSGYLEAVSGSFAQLTQTEVITEDVITQAHASNNDYLQHWIKQIYPKCSSKLVENVISPMSQYLGEGRDFITFSKLALAWFNDLLQHQQQIEHDPTMEVYARYQEERQVWENLTREILESLGIEITLASFLQELQMRSKEPPIKPNTVVLMTIHGAKGKEFQHVYLIGLVDDELPSFQSKQKGNNSPEMEEERRNCFVAITRTIKSLTLSYSEKYRGWIKEPSRFLFEMGLLDDKNE